MTLLNIQQFTNLVYQWSLLTHMEFFPPSTTQAIKKNQKTILKTILKSNSIQFNESYYNNLRWAGDTSRGHPAFTRWSLQFGKWMNRLLFFVKIIIVMTNFWFLHSSLTITETKIWPDTQWTLKLQPFTIIDLYRTALWLWDSINCDLVGKIWK